jgi:hypothetical protein
VLLVFKIKPIDQWNRTLWLVLIMGATLKKIYKIKIQMKNIEENKNSK